MLALNKSVIKVKESQIKKYAKRFGFACAIAAGEPGSVGRSSADQSGGVSR